jgi:mRNA interferase HicA
MKRQDLIRHVEAHGYLLLREGARHRAYYSPANNQTSAIPRHREINEFLARKIFRDLGIPER